MVFRPAPATTRISAQCVRHRPADRRRQHGHGRTIVILDAFQSPNIVQQLNTYDSFYGLPGLNGLGNPPNASLGTFTQIAPQGLTPFVPGDPNMTGWAEEISLDVLWATPSPRGNIVLDLSTDNSDGALQAARRTRSITTWGT